MPPCAERTRDDLDDAWRALRRSGELTLREVACVGVPQTLFVADVVRRPHAPWITLAGEEQPKSAAPWALLSIVRDGLLFSRFAYRIWPRVTGSDEAPQRGSPQFRAIATANRDRRFMLGIELCQGEGDAFVCECDGTAQADGTAAAVTVALAALGFEANGKQRVPSTPSLLPRRTTDRTLRLAVPRSAAWNDCITMHRVAVSVVLAYMERSQAKRT
ncbi:MAG: hypothetical protein GIX03_07800 [Candidatus Eremiobacteraeota bacterium]|nr:hypothetical protein [Candidatus Eremiobacteraeota bacterium]MBC5802890.1 hypothetical protein [Candidatus Eremiobacteraeota bacterium]MBC5821169.1 hypothetical protein [Candidatus Eremiobacteraeota bacterium]